MLGHLILHATQQTPFFLKLLSLCSTANTICFATRNHHSMYSMQATIVVERSATFVSQPQKKHSFCSKEIPFFKQHSKQHAARQVLRQRRKDRKQKQKGSPHSGHSLPVRMQSDTSFAQKRQTLLSDKVKSDPSFDRILSCHRLK